MSRTIHADVITEIAKDNFQQVTLISIAFDSTVYLTSGFHDISYSGNSYEAGGHFLGISNIKESANVRVGTIKLTLSAVNQTYVSIVLSQDIINRQVLIYRAFLDTANAIIGDPLLTYDGTITVEGMNIGINSMGSSAEVTLNIDGIDSILRETKTKEIYNNYYFSLQEYTYKGSSDESFIIIEVTPFVLEEDQYLIQRSSTLNVLDKDITLDDSKSDGYIVITVCDEGTLFCEEIETILKGDTEEIRGVNIKNVEHFYRVYQYAILEVTEI